MGVIGGEEGQKDAESLFKEIMTETFPNLGSDTDIQIHQVHRSCRFNSKNFVKIHYHKIFKDKKR